MRAAAIAAVLLAGGVAAAHPFEPVLLVLAERDGGRFEVRARPGAPEGEAPRIGLPEGCGRTGDTIDCGAAGLRGRAVTVDGGGREVVVRVELAGGDEVHASLPGAGTVAIPAPQARASAARAVAAALRLGVAHVATGADHLLFLVGLVLLVRGRRALVWAVTAFTIAHAAALALATLGLVTVPAAPVEAVIALSIFMLAVELSRERPSALGRWPAPAALAFGLVHGLGFAAALGELGIARGDLWPQLLGFNLGVEAAQLVFVAACAAARAAVGERLGRKAPAHVIGAVSFAWMLARVAAFWERA